MKDGIEVYINNNKVNMINELEDDYSNRIKEKMNNFEMKENEIKNKYEAIVDNNNEKFNTIPVPNLYHSVNNYYDYVHTYSSSTRCHKRWFRLEYDHHDCRHVCHRLFLHDQTTTQAPEGNRELPQRTHYRQ